MLSIVFHWSVCQGQAVLINVALWVLPQTQGWSFPSLAGSSGIVLHTYFCNMNFRTDLFVLKYCWSFHWDDVTHNIDLEGTDIFMMLHLLSQKCALPSPLFKHVFMSLWSALKFSSHRSWVFLLKISPRYFIFIVGIVSFPYYTASSKGMCIDSLSLSLPPPSFFSCLPLSLSPQLQSLDTLITPDPFPFAPESWGHRCVLLYVSPPLPSSLFSF